MALAFLDLFGANLLLTLIVLAVASIPLYFAVKLMSGDVGFIEAIIINLIAGGVPIVIGLFFNSYIKLLSFIAIIGVYMFFFKLGVGKAVLAWLIQYAVVFGILWLLGSVHIGILGI